MPALRAIYAVMEKMEENADMVGEWEINKGIWLKEVGESKVQESVLKRRCGEAHEAVAADAVAPLIQPRQEEAASNPKWIHKYTLPFP